MLCGQRHDPMALSVDERISADEQRAGVVLNEAGERRIHVAIFDRIEDVKL